MPFHFLLCFLLIVFLSSGVLRADMPVLVLQGGVADLVGNAEMLEDTEGTLSVADVSALDQAHHYQRLAEGGWYKDVGFSRSAYWFRLRLDNNTQETDWYFEQWGSLSRTTDVYLASAEAGSATRFVRLKPLPNARIIQYHVPLVAGAKQVLYFRVQDKHTPLVIAARLVDTQHMIDWVTRSYPLISFVIGGLFILALYNFLYFLYLHDYSFLSLSVLILTFTLEMGSHLGLWQSIAWMRDHLAGLGVVFGAISAASAIMLMRQWLNMPVNLPKTDKGWRLAFWASLGIAVIAPFVPFSLALLGWWFVLVLLPMGCVTLTLFFSKGLRLPASLILAGVVFMVAMLPALLRGAGLIDEMYGLAQWPVMGLLLALILLSLAQADHMRKRRQQAEGIVAANQAKDEFLTTMSHELRTPMNAVVGAGQLLKLTALSTEQQDYVERMNISSRHMLALVNDVLDLARLDHRLLKIDSVPFQLNTLLKQTEQLLSAPARDKGLTLHIDNRFHLLNRWLLGDPVRLQQILINLLNNAVKFTHEGDIRLRILPQAVTAETVSLLFEVSDTGIGISKQQQQTLFQPFTQADNSTARKYGGSGLGLAISYKLLNQMGSALMVDSQLGKGSRFSFMLNVPVQDAVLPDTGMQSFEPTVMSCQVKQPQVLLVDDNEMNRFFGKRMLESLGAVVTTAVSGTQALDFLSAKPFDVVLMDVSMPDMDGYATTRKIRANPRFQYLPVVAVTAHAIAGERERCSAAGMDDYLSKPFVLENLHSLMRRHCVKQRGRVCS